MSINIITLSEKMTGELDRAVVQKAMTGFLSDNAMRAKFVGAGTVLIPDVEFSGLGDYCRDGGFAQGSINVAIRCTSLRWTAGAAFCWTLRTATSRESPALRAT